MAAVAAVLLVTSFLLPPQPPGGAGGIDGGSESPVILDAEPSATASSTPGVSSGADAASTGAVSPGPTASPPPSPTLPPGATAERMALLRACEDDIPDCYVYDVRLGDTLTGIASYFGVSVEQILAMTPSLKNGSRLAVGTSLTLPAPTR